MTTPVVLTEMNLFVGQERLLLQPIASPSSEVIVIDRLTHETRVTSFDPSLIPGDSERKLVFGIMGTISLIAGPYLILVTAVTKMGEVSGHSVWRIDRTELVPHTKTTRHLTEDQVRFNTTYLSMIRQVLDTEYFYFCNSYDLTHTCQRLNQRPADFDSMSLFDRSDKRFVWNASLLSDWNSRPELKKFCVPVIHGFIGIRNVHVNGTTFRWILISRRGVWRAGCRLLVRGSDRRTGDPANFVETEQVIEYQTSGTTGRCSFVQIRGSIPLLWSQSPNLKYKPPPVPIPSPDQPDVMAKHVDDVTATYGPVVLVNLINQTGAEGRMEQEFASTVRSLNHPLVRYEAFDFHHECRKMRWDRLSLLMDRLSRDQEEIGYFHVTQDSANHPPVVQKVQKGIFRTNCIDSLDRTNVVQGLLARRSLEQQLRRLSILSPGESVSQHPDFERVYRNVWADNADILSIQYSGTGALKTDFTRTGKRTVLGAIRDGVHSLTRYYKNNLTDGVRQDAIDLFLGLHVVDAREGLDLPCKLDRRKDWKFAALPLILLGSVAMFFFSILLPHEHGTETFAYLLFWAAMASISVSVILYYGHEFVDFPRLRPEAFVVRSPNRRSSASRLLHQET